MYEKTRIFITSYLKFILPDIESYDSNYEFVDPKDYAAFFIELDPSSPFENLVSTGLKDEDTKTFTYRKRRMINIRVDFRGSKCFKNMAVFESSFLLSKNKDFFKTAGFGFFGLSGVTPISTIRGSKTKQGVTSTLKLSGFSLVVDEDQIVKEFEVTAIKVNTLK